MKNARNSIWCWDLRKQIGSYVLGRIYDTYRFESDFTFKLTRDEWQDLRSKNLTSSWGGSRYAPNVFTEQGVYMLMTILKGELAAKQSRDLVQTFKKMKDYILGNQTLIGQREVMRMSCGQGKR